MCENQKIAVLENEVEASFLETILMEREIPFNIRSYHDSAYDGLFQLVKGWGAVYAPVDFKDEILEILNELRNSQEV
ncbi:MAG: hypothetical protein CVV03_11110 [Firmicutes bacterium HGW-Firmicutes-8]|nr:MAG: hypothetical protein CVV03_11110 [Firmicutes bacterium HGW-Firmicutes-8]